MRDPHEDVEYGGGGVYTEIDPPSRLAFTWLWDDNDTRQLIEIDFEEADGATTVRFTHSGLWDEEAVRSHEGGWRHGLRQPRADARGATSAVRHHVIEADRRRPPAPAQAIGLRGVGGRLVKRKPATLRGSLTRPRMSSSSNSAIHDRATRWRLPARPVR